MNTDDIFKRMVQGNIIQDPKLIWDLFYIFHGYDESKQLKVISRLLEICQQSIHNPLLLLTKTVQITPDNTKLYILNLLVDQTLSSKISDQLFDLISYLVYYCDLKKTHIEHLIKKLPNSSTQQLLLILRFFQLFLISPKMPPPYSYFFFNAQGSGLSISQMLYPFKKALTFCAWIRLEGLQKASRLFTFHIKGQGGLEAYIIDDLLYYRSLGQEYFVPAKGSNGILLCRLPLQVWIFLSFSHRSKEKLHRNQVKVVVNDSEVLSSMMDLPNVNENEMTTAGIGLDFYGQMSCVMFFNDVLTVDKMKSLYHHYNFGPHSNESLMSIDVVITGNASKCLLMIFHPERTYKNYTYSAIGSIVAKLIGLTGAKSMTIRKNTSFGGILMLLPILNRIIQLQSSDLLIEWFRLVMLCLKDRPNNQNEAVSAGFFKILAQCLEDIPACMVSEEIVNIIDDLKNSGNNKLPEQVFINLLWNIKLWAKGDLNTQLRVLGILKNMYSKNRGLAKVVGLEYMLDNFKVLTLPEAIQAYVEIVEFVVFTYQEQSITESFVKFLCCRPNTDIQIHILEGIRMLATGLGPHSSIFIKQIIEAKGVEILTWCLNSKNSKVKYFSVVTLESLLNNYKIPVLSSQNDFYPYIASLFSPDLLLESKEQEVFQTVNDDSFLDVVENAGHKNRKSLTFAISSERRSSFSNIFMKSDEQLYHAALEIMLDRIIEGTNILDDTDYIHSVLGLRILQEVVRKSSPEIKHKALQDQLMLTKWNKKNCNILVDNVDWHYWLLDIILETHDNVEAADAIVDIGIRLHNTVLHQGMEHNDAWGYIKRLSVWFEKENKDYVPRLIVRKILENFLATAGKLVTFSENFWKNTVLLGYFIEEFVVYSYARSSDKPEEKLCVNKIWEDFQIVQLYTNLVKPVWDKTLNIVSCEDLYIQIKGMTIGKLKNEAMVLNFEPDGDLKRRGKFAVVFFHIICMGIKETDDSINLEFWLTVLENLIKTILLITESNKKTLTKQEGKLYSNCVAYALGYLCIIIQKKESKPLLYLTLAKLLKFTFSTFSSNNRKSHQSGIKSILKINQNQYSSPCNYIISAISQQTKGIENWIGLINQYTNRNVQDFISQPEVQNALFYIYFLVQEKFHCFNRQNFICLDRERSLEKYLQENSSTILQTEMANSKLAIYIKDCVNQIRSEENKKILQREMEKELKSYKRKKILEKIIQNFSSKANDLTTTEFKLQQKLYHDLTTTEFKLQQKLCKDFSRPFLARKSYKKKYVSSKKQPVEELSLKPINFKEIRRNSLSIEEEDIDFLEDLKNKISEETGKTTGGFSGIVGLICPMMIKYGYIHIKYTKKEPKLLFCYDQGIQEKYSTSIELFAFNPTDNSGIYTKTWKLNSLVNVFPKSYLMQPTAVELIFAEGKTLLINFINKTSRIEFLLEIKKIKKGLLNLKISKPKVSIKAIPLSSYKPQIFVDPSITEKWVNWQISNFEYLMYLNYCAGRSYNDLTQYPVMPWVISNYESESPTSSYRDMSKNMGSLGSQERISIFTDRFKCMANDNTDPPFHFGSHYSNPTITLFYLIRLSPFDDCAKELQGGKFDLPDRLFSSINESYLSAIEDIADVRELIPEFFCLPEMFLNINQTTFGFTQSGQQIDNIILPKWTNSAYDFIKINREALESEQVSANINKWIDLIFGYKQQGIEAEKALNVFYYLTYENNVDLEKINDEALLKTLLTQMYHFGRTPTQLFTRPHIQKKAFNKILDLPNIFSQPCNMRVLLSGLSKIKNNPVGLSLRSVIRIKVIRDREIYCLRLNRTITKYNFIKLTVGNEICISCDPVQNIDYIKDSFLNYEDTSIPYHNCPFQFFNSCKSVAFGGFWDGRIQVRRYLNGETTNLKFVHNSFSTVTCIEFSDDEKTAISGSRDGECVIWKIDNELWTFKYNFANHEDEVTSICIAEDIHTFATGSLDGKCNLYCTDSYKMILQIALPGNKPITITKFSLAAPCKVILYSPEDRTVYFYSVNGLLINTIQEHFNINALIVVRYPTYEDFLVYASDKGDVIIRKAGNGEKFSSCSLGIISPITCVAVTADYKYIFVGCIDGEIAIIAL
ncbi:hypothetical protein SteCoe_8641 [Stentor coeruleus]|uniref:BEACH domain-containing protein n=1 Tax=Stentor coeruleus TaxID=5963 RepID=A0A1R2CJS6_9CILI|nr:hypothetical protein SteCoe_8641 [Stentor coeruleus]